MIPVAIILIGAGVTSPTTAYADMAGAWNPWRLRLLGGARTGRVFYVARGVGLIVVAAMLLAVGRW